ncbi:MAG: hypothetical protein M5U34_13405 [Chloroflexi bacterium]|nr:hypothetical protein [Chloroflexota bacterium]
MHISDSNRPAGNGRFQRNISYFLVAPLTTLVIVSLILAFIVSAYQNQHNERIYTGVNMMGVDLSGLTPAGSQEPVGRRHALRQRSGHHPQGPRPGPAVDQNPGRIRHCLRFRANSRDRL